MGARKEIEVADGLPPQTYMVYIVGVFYMHSITVDPHRGICSLGDGEVGSLSLE